MADTDGFIGYSGEPVAVFRCSASPARPEVEAWRMLACWSCGLACGAFESCGAEISDAGMASGAIGVAFDAEKDVAADCFPIRQILAMEPFDFERMGEAFGHGVVVAASGLAHALLDASLAAGNSIPAHAAVAMSAPSSPADAPVIAETTSEIRRKFHNSF